MMTLLRLRYECRRVLAIALARFKLHRVRTIETSDGEVVSKTRRRTSATAVGMGNLYLWMQQAGVEVLRTAEWQRWELAIWRAQRADNSQVAAPQVQSRGLLFPKAPGEPLSKILAAQGLSVDRKLLCFGWAVRSLAQLHAQEVDWGVERVQPVSHGDATANNVIIDVDGSHGSVCWIDFDTRHLERLGTLERHADDLRALIFSAAVHLPQSQFDQLATQLVDLYCSRNVLAHFRGRLNSRWCQPNVFQLAQAPLPLAKARVLIDELSTRLPE